MAYSEKDIEEIFSTILERIEKGEALRQILKEEKMPSSQTFYVWIEKDEVKSKRYARATELRADAIFEDILDIADDSSGDIITDKEGNEKINTEFVQRSRLKVDARKWIVAKLNPKKYGDKQQIDHTTDGEKINQPPIFQRNPLANE